MTRLTPLVLVVFALLPLSGAAQTPKTTSEQKAPPQAVFRSGVELVRLDVRALDGQDRPVKDLRAEEVEVYEGGRPRPLRLFQHVAEPDGSYLEAARRTVGGEVSTNQGAPRGHLYVIVFDQVHLAAGNEQRARVAVEQFLKTRVRPGDRVAIYGLPGPGPSVSFTSNARAAAAELVKVRGSLERSSPTASGVLSTYEAYQVLRGDGIVRDRVAQRITQTPGLLDLQPARPEARTVSADTAQALNEQVLGAARTVVDGADAESRAFLRYFTDVIDQLADVEGRKSIVLLSEGFYADNVAYEIEQVAAAAARAYAVIYALDLNRRSVDVSADRPSGGEQFSEIQNRLESLGNLSANTDGQMFPDATSEIDRALNRIADTTQDYYILGFEPEDTSPAGRLRYHRVTVNVLRRGVNVRARTGFSLKDPAVVAGTRRGFDSALTAPFSQPGVPLELTTYVLRGTTRGFQRVILSLEAELPLRSTTSASADVVFVVKKAVGGAVAASGTDKMALPVAARVARTTGIGRYTVQFQAPAGDYVMRVAVREPGGTVGSVDRRFHVRALDGPDMTASDLILGGQTGGMLPVRAMARSNDMLTGVLEIYARRPSDLDSVQVVVDLGRVGEEAPVTSSHADLMESQPLTVGASRGARVAVPLEGVPPGQYVVRAIVRSASGETVAELSREVEVLAANASIDAEEAPRSERAAPAEILAGDIGRQVLLAARASTREPAVVAAADLAVGGNWQKVEPALRASGPGFSAAVLRGLSSFAFDRYDKAANELNAALEGIPQPQDAKMAAGVSFLLGWVLTYAGRDVEALTAWRSAIARDSTLIPAYLALANAYLRRSQPALAVQVLDSGLKAVHGSFEIERKLRQIQAGGR